MIINKKVPHSLRRAPISSHEIGARGYSGAAHHGHPRSVTMRLHTLLLALAGMASMATAASAADILVPTDAPNVQAAVFASSPGDVIRVQTSAIQSGTLSIQHPLSIVGDPVCNYRFGYGQDAFVLNGPGSGEVILANISLSYLAGDSNGSRSVWGGGFDHVAILDSTFLHNNTEPTGTITSVFPAVELSDVARLSVMNSTLLGGPAGTDSCVLNPQLFAENGAPGIQAPNTDVLLVSSTVTGGAGGSGLEIAFNPCPPSVDTWNGRGGDGVVARSLHMYASTVSGGQGVLWQSDPTGFCQGAVDCGQAADGLAQVVSGTQVVADCSRLGLGPTIGAQAPATQVLGGSVAFHWDGTAPGCWPALTGCAPSCVGLLFVSLDLPGRALPFGTTVLHLDPAGAQLLQAFPAHTQTVLNFPVPSQPTLIGQGWSAQAWVSTGELSAPVFGTVR